jgi:hypothetical protein
VLPKLRLATPLTLQTDKGYDALRRKEYESLALAEKSNVSGVSICSMFGVIPLKSFMDAKDNIET